jgi:hypothetical protein
MPSWQDFVSAVAPRYNWTTGAGEAYHTWRDDGGVINQVLLAISPYALEPTHRRASLAGASRDMEWEIRTNREGEYNLSADLRRFSIEWEQLWRAGCCAGRAKVPPFAIIPGVPEGYKAPAPLDFTPDMRDAFRKFNISRTVCAPTWGQPGSYVDLSKGAHEPVADWQGSNCPFCDNTFGSLEQVPRGHYHAPEQTYYGGGYRPLLCSYCERILDVM